VAQALADLGVDELDLGDTIGAAEPGDMTLLLHALIGRLGDDVIPMTTLHLHDTFGRAAESAGEALQLGVRSFDGSVAGLGGCPYASTPARRAPGNISTEALVRRVRGDGFECGVDLARLEEAAAFARALVAGTRGQEAGV
jgi:hydroxymethylglutaryl-CoA lyase